MSQDPSKAAAQPSTGQPAGFWARNTPMLANNKLGYQPSQPVALHFKTEPTNGSGSNPVAPEQRPVLTPASSTSSSNHAEKAPQPTIVVASVPAPAPTPVSVAQPVPVVQPVPAAGPPQTPAITSQQHPSSTPAVPPSGAPPTARRASTSASTPIPIGNFGLWAAYYNPASNVPYFYLHAEKKTQYQVPDEIKLEFEHIYPAFLAKIFPSRTPPVQQTTPPLSDQAQSTSNTITPIQHENSNPSQSVSTTLAPLTLQGDSTPEESPVAAVSTATKQSLTINTSSPAGQGQNMFPAPQQAAQAKPSITLPPTPGAAAVAAAAAQAAAAATTTSPAPTTPVHSTLSPEAQRIVSTAPTAMATTTTTPQQQSTIPFSQLLKVDPAPTIKEGHMWKQTVGFRKVWKSRYVILFQGALRYWDDKQQAKSQMNNPNAIVSISGCSLRLPPTTSGIHPRQGFIIDANVGDTAQLVNAPDTDKENEVVQFLAKFTTVDPHEYESWVHIMYRSCVIDGRYVINPDLASSTEAVPQQLQALFTLWSQPLAHDDDATLRESSILNDTSEHQLADNVPSTTSSSSAVTSPTNQTPQFPPPLPPLTPNSASTAVPVSPSQAQLKQLQLLQQQALGSMYGYKPIPVPVRSPKRRVQEYAVMFADRIEVYATYDDAMASCNYHNPDSNLLIDLDKYQRKLKITETIYITSRSTYLAEVLPTGESSLTINTAESKLRHIKPSSTSLIFDSCNPMTGIPQTGPASTDSKTIVDKWSAALQFCLDGPVSGTFSSSLAWSIGRSPSPLPQALYHTIRYILQSGLKEEGLLRIPGNQQEVVKLKRLFDSGLTEVPVNEPHTAAGLLKLYLREVVDGLIPFPVYKDFVSVGCRHAAQGASAEARQPKVAALKVLVQQLPEINQLCLSAVVYLLVKISENANINKMFAKNCAMVVAPNLFRREAPLSIADGRQDRSPNPQKLAETMVEEESILLIMIEHFNEVFPRGSPFLY